MLETIRHAPIDVGALVRRSYRHLGEDFRRLLLVSLGAAFALGLCELTIASFADLWFGDDRKPADFTSGWGLILGIAAFGLGILRYLLLVAVAVHWHRSILAGEHSWRTLQIGGREARYFLWLVAWVAAFVVVMILVYSTLRYAGMEFSLSEWLGIGEPPVDEDGQLWRVLISVAAYAVLIAPFYVIALVLPAKAVDDKEFGFLSALTATRGNFWRIAIASLFFKPPILALMLLAFGVGDAIANDGGLPLRFLTSVLVDAAMFMWVCLEAGFLSFVYQALRGGVATAER
ncbi:MAG: hypothetical protein NTY59_00745 [Alphaproteobacteria bacterium]|nr:hypothetical protein [Alphaproteobacteria bacterium]